MIMIMELMMVITLLKTRIKTERFTWISLENLKIQNEDDNRVKGFTKITLLKLTGLLFTFYFWI